MNELLDVPQEGGVIDLPSADSWDDLRILDRVAELRLEANPANWSARIEFPFLPAADWIVRIGGGGSSADRVVSARGFVELKRILCHISRPQWLNEMNEWVETD